MYSKVEQELIKASGFDQQPMTYAVRDDFLKMLQQNVNKMDQADWDKMSEAAQDWSIDAATAVNEQRVIPDFQDWCDDEDVEEEPGTEALDGSDVHADNKHEPAEAEQNPKPGKARAKAGKGRSGKTRSKANSGGVAPTPSTKKVVSNKELMELPVDRYGCIEGSKVSRALKLFEKGARMKEVKEELGGGTYYNILKKVAGDGHKVEQMNGLISLTHKEDVK